MKMVLPIEHRSPSGKMPATKEIDFEGKDQLERKRRENEARQPISMVTPTRQLCLEQGISHNPHIAFGASPAHDGVLQQRYKGHCCFRIPTP
ncbi:hypothetical protein [Neorhizobium sp. T6_25]|jgi:hypothetical protein|uniref:hypothetical protein n=1 Tax=Neorhizobium sp. T6_25 TaxID=2093833 RepID=UPI00155E0B64|nr:hypothetical protein [Neorhizobium sp. T6_25]